MPIKATMHAEPMPGPQPGFGRISAGNSEMLGNAVHAYFAAMPSLFKAPEKQKLACAKRALENNDVADLMYPGAAWHTEVPVSAPAKDGRQWSGTIDLLLELADGRFALVDHKSAPAGADAWASKAQEYSGQVLGYAEALKDCGMKGVECWIHLPLGGGVMRMA
ncbi:MAG: hypothetical protein HY748_07905 [Elusimicrobia bacterium]|nr:hypothetical protein [Elusimicrobiota bacterium]